MGGLQALERNACPSDPLTLLHLNAAMRVAILSFATSYSDYLETYKLIFTSPILDLQSAFLAPVMSSTLFLATCSIASMQEPLF